MEDVVLTFDIDWAPDFAINYVADELIRKEVRATWFVTHDSPAIDRLREYPGLFELGIHPNFLSGSTHGETHEEVLRHCFNIVPDAVSIRTHGLYQSSHMFDKISCGTDIKYDVSLFMPLESDLQPLYHHFSCRGLCRVPYFWEDDYEMVKDEGAWEIEGVLEGYGQGLKVFDFHPIHVYLNSSSMEEYSGLKECVSDLRQAEPGQAGRFRRDGVGTKTLLFDLVDYLSSKEDSKRIKDLEFEGGHKR